MANKIIDDVVYFLERDSDGKYEIQAEHLLSDLSNTVPSVGDRITLTINGDGATSTMEVVGRHLISHLDRASDCEWTAWFLIVQGLDPREADDLFELVSEHFSQYIQG
ncbi:hypothetical protein [Rhizobium grahamii]|uniref:Uncharacterized protein n=1 Tax=Rhizobium grahamii CCGE 502 TaxID=990285 RepID=S3IIG7_9HYPH|nr:hypothetical protein [Rhizobium grahamii]EPE98643.1 hypothetical protein RGCCGE502_09460 [Rhizobium grahamii CCGE 502]